MRRSPGTVIVPQPVRPPSVAVPVLVACAAVVVVFAVSGGVATLAIQGKAAAARPMNGMATLCPAAATERRP